MSEYRKYIIGFCLLVITAGGWTLRYTAVRMQGYGNYREWSTKIYMGGITPDYTSSAKNLRRRFFFSRDGRNPDFYRLPGYPAFLSLFYDRDYEKWLTRIRIAQITLDSACIVMVYVLAGLLFSSPMVALFAAAGYAFAPPFVVQATVVLAESVNSMLFVTLLLLLLWMVRAGRARAGLAAGFAFAMGSFFRAEFLLLFVFAPLLAAVYSLFKRLPARPLIVKIALFMLAFIAGYSWWPIRNYRIAGRLIPATTGGWQTMWEALGCICPDNHLGAVCNDAVVGEKLGKMGLQYASVEADEYLKGEFLKIVRADPRYVFRCVRKRMKEVATSIGVSRFGPPIKTNLEIFAKIFLVVDAILFIATFWKKPELFFAIFPLFYFTVANGLTHYEPRYVTPVFLTHVFFCAYLIVLAARILVRADEGFKYAGGPAESP